MNKSYLGILLTLTCVFGLGLSAHAQDTSRVIVKVPFDFVAGGETLPAGTYTVSRTSSNSQPGLVIRNDENSTFLLPIVFDGDPADQAKLGFVHVGDKYFLSKIETPAGVYTIGTPRPLTKVAQMKDSSGSSSSGTH